MTKLTILNSIYNFTCRDFYSIIASKIVGASSSSVGVLVLNEKQEIESIRVDITIDNLFDVSEIEDKITQLKLDIKSDPRFTKAERISFDYYIDSSKREYDYEFSVIQVLLFLDRKNMYKEEDEIEEDSSYAIYTRFPKQHKSDILNALYAISHITNFGINASSDFLEKIENHTSVGLEIADNNIETVIEELNKIINVTYVIAGDTSAEIMNIINNFGIAGKLTFRQNEINMIAHIEYENNTEESFKYAKDETESYIVSDLENYHSFNNPIVKLLVEKMQNKIGLKITKFNGGVEVSTDIAQFDVVEKLVKDIAQNVSVLTHEKSILKGNYNYLIEIEKD